MKNMRSKPFELQRADILAVEDAWQRRLSRVRRLLKPGPSSEGRVVVDSMHRCPACGRLQGSAEAPSTFCGRCDKLAAIA